MAAWARILGNACIHDMAEFVIEERFLVQRQADAPDHAADDLAARGLGVQDMAGRDRADDAGDADDAELLVHVHFDEYGRARVVGIQSSDRRKLGIRPQ